MADVELAVEVIGFVQEGAGQQFFSGLLINFSVHILCTDGDLVGSGYVLAEFRDAEAAFALRVLAFGVDDFGIDENELGFGIFFKSYVDDGDAAGEADLRGSEADAVGGVHRLEHIVD